MRIDPFEGLDGDNEDVNDPFEGLDGDNEDGRSI